MSIGLFDLDSYNHKVVPFNLELMKIATYYKNRNEIVTLTNEFVPQNFSKYIVAQDYRDNIFPLDITPYSNVELIGRAFSNNYVPLLEDIEKSVPDLSIYNKKKDNYKGKDLLFYNSFMAAAHCRLSLDGKTIWNDYKSQIRSDHFRTLYVYDYDLGSILAAPEELRQLCREKSITSLTTRYPVYIDNATMLKRWLRLPWLGNPEIIYRGELSLKDINTLSKSKRKVTLCYNFDGLWSGTNKNLINDFSEILKQVIFSQKGNLILLLKSEREYYLSKYWKTLLHLLNLCSRNRHYYNIRKRTLVDYIKQYKKQTYNVSIPIEDIREAFIYFRDNIPELFELFYTCNYDSLLLEGRI